MGLAGVRAVESAKLRTASPMMSRKLRLLGKQQQQQIQGSSNEASQTIGADINNAAAHAELLRAEQLSLQHNSQLAFYAQAKAQQIDNIQASLQRAIHSQATK